MNESNPISERSEAAAAKRPRCGLSSQSSGLRVAGLAAAAWALAAGLVQDASGADRARTRTVQAQPSWTIQTSQVEISVTERGGHMAPVTFFRDSARPVQPYHLSPWQGEGLDLDDVPVLVPLRGDWFCMPFGGNGAAYRGEQHPPHGEVAGSRWRQVGVTRAGASTTLTLELSTTARPGKVTKELTLIEGHNVVYSRHTIEGFAGKTSLGHHATLAMPDEEGVFRIATSPIRFGRTNPTQFSDPAGGEYQSFAINEKFARLDQVPLIWKGAADADVTRLPARKGFADLLQLVSVPAAELNGPAWITAHHTRAGWVWFALKDPEVLPTTVMWIENRGRHRKPWYGRNNCLGLEDVCAYFADGLAASAGENLLTREGVKTAHELTAARPFVVNYLQGVVQVPAGFDAVKTLEFAPGQVTFVAQNGRRATAPVDHAWLKR
jgi:hypothetical protein